MLNKRWIKNVLVMLFLPVASRLAWRLGVGKSRLKVRSEGEHFPTVSGFNLNRQELEFPRDFGGELNLLFVPFLQYQQATVDTWIPFARELEESVPDLRYYELPTIEERSRLARTFINEGMRAGIPDPLARERTVTLYVDKRAFQRATRISGDDQVHILLVNRQGDILWRTTGKFTPQKGQELRAFLEGRQSDPPR